MKQWMTAAEISALDLPGDGWSKSAVLRRAAREQWPSRPRSGRGGGVEFPASALPADALGTLASRAIQKSEPFRPAAPPVDAARLKGWQRSALEARAAILQQVESLAGNVGSIMLAERAFADAAASGTLPPALFELVERANERKGACRTISAATLRRWRGIAKAESVIELAPKARAAAGPQPWLFPLLQLYARPTQPSISWCLERLAIERPDLELPPLRTAQVAIQSLGKLTRSQGRIGPRALRSLRAYTVRTFEDLEPLDVISADGHTFKAEVAHPSHGKPFRPEIVTVIDVATRMVIGWSAGLAEGAWIVADALRDAAKVGIGAIFYTDNGSGFVNDHLNDLVLGVLGRLGTSHRTAIAYNAQARGVIERLQSSLWGRAAKELPAYVGRDMDREARQLTYKRSRADLKLAGQSRLIMPWPEFLAFAQSQIDAYNHRPHSSLPRFRGADGATRHQSPAERWSAFSSEGWAPVAPIASELDDLFRPYDRRRVVRSAVSLFGNSYFHRALEDYDLHGRDVLVGYDIHDPSRVWVRDLDERLVCVAELGANKAAYFPQSQVDAAREQRARGRLRRLNIHRDEVMAELTGPNLVLAADDGETVIDAERLAIAEAELRALEAPAPVAPAISGRPIFNDDMEWARWLTAHPDLATDQDRIELRQHLRSRDFQTRLEFDGLDFEALTGLVTSTEARFSA